MPDEMVVIINRVFGEMKVTWGRKYTSRFRTTEEVSSTKRQWAKTFSRLRVTKEQIRFALDAAISKKMTWPPELPEFLELCDSAEALGLPSADDAYQEVVDRHGKNKFITDYQWSAYIVKVVNDRIGKYATSEAEKYFRPRFNRAWEQAVSQYKFGNLPKVYPALPTPELEPICASYDYDTKKHCPIQSRIDALRNHKANADE